MIKKCKRSDERPHIAVVIPVYGCAECLIPLYERLVESLRKINQNYEIVMVNDASPDDAWKEIISLSSMDHRVKGINLSRNFSQHRAIYAGLDYVEADWTVVMDCDLQDRPEEIVNLYNTAMQGSDLVFGLRSNRQDSFIKKLASRLFTRIFNYLTETDVGEDVTNFTILSSAVVASMRRLREQNAFYIVNLYWLGFNRKFIYVKHAEREYGKSSYTLPKLMGLALDSMISHSNKPLKLMIKFGLLIAVVSLMSVLWLVIRYYLYEIPIEGWTSIMVSINFMGGLLLANLGVLGLYIGKSFDEQKKRPLYVIKETINMESCP